MIGRSLEQARKERNLSLEQAEEATKIRARYLRELERENFDVLPAVYARGSLKTYANFLHLDGEALSRELKRRQEPQDEPQDPASDDSPGVGLERRSLVPGVLAGVFGGAGREETAEGRETDEGDERAGPIPLSPRSPGASYLYLGSGVFLILVAAATVLALTLPENAETPVAQVREPLTSKAGLSVDPIVDLEPLRDRPFRTAGGSPVPDKDDSPEKRDEENKEEKGDGRSEQAGRDKTEDAATQKKSTEPADQGTLAFPESSPVFVVPDVDQAPEPEIAEPSPGTTPSSTATASAAPSTATTSAPSSVPASSPSSASPAPSSAPPPPAPAEPSQAPTGGGGLGSVQAGVDVPVAPPDGSEMADEIIDRVNAETPVPTRGGGLPVQGQDLPGDTPYGALPDNSPLR